MEIPLYPDSRALEFSDKALFDGIFERLQPRVSELTFAGLYLFRRAHDYRMTAVRDALVLLGRGYDGRRRFLPPLGGDVAAALDTLFGAGEELYGADEAFAARYLSGAGLEVTEERDSCDYLYLREDLATLPGNRFHKKKNRISYFTARHRYEVEAFSPARRCGCLELLDAWYRLAEHEENPSLDLELEAAAEGVTMTEELGLEGVIVTVEGVVKAFALGERLNRETAVCHFEKADPFMEGLSQLVNREFARLLFSDCRYINREQDLGEPGLRNAKLSYHPVELVRKFRARRAMIR
ncbi:MAG: DUF2156 domain-containing protein [Deltaproteobacteria bacterium]|nr:DUF2156 domain-containing protein [Deltaproteobacteria bacterium]